MCVFVSLLRSLALATAGAGAFDAPVISDFFNEKFSIDPFFAVAK